MGIGYTTMMYDAETLEEGIGDIAACRYDGVEIGIGKIRSAGADTVATWLDEYELDLYLVMGDWPESPSVVERLADEASIVADLGAEYVGILPPQRNRHDDETVEEMLLTLCESVTGAGLTPLLHHHGATHVEQPAEIEQYLSLADNLGLLFDTAHYYPYGDHYPVGDVTDGIERFADEIEYVHLKDVDPPPDFTEHREKLTDGTFHLDNVINYFRSFTDLGDGTIDFEAVHGALEGVGFDGHCTIEIENQKRDRLVHAKENLDYWRSVQATSR